MIFSSNTFCSPLLRIKYIICTSDNAASPRPFKVHVLYFNIVTIVKPSVLYSPDDNYFVEGKGAFLKVMRTRDIHQYNMNYMQS